MQIAIPLYERFTALEKSLGVSPRTLSERLKELEDQNIVDRRAFAEVFGTYLVMIESLTLADVDLYLWLIVGSGTEDF